MPNQLNYPDRLNSTYLQRPERLAQYDLDLIRLGQKQVVFGLTATDMVEVWVYDPNGAIVGHLNVAPTDTALSLVTLVDQSGPQEILNIDFADVAQRMGIAPGRYAVVLNFFRDEVGSEAGYKLYLSDISDDRTEVRITPVELAGAVIKDLYEFVVPSVPKQFAKGLVDQLFGRSLDFVDGEQLTFTQFQSALEAARSNTNARVAFAGRGASLQATFNKIVDQAYPLALDRMTNDVRNLNIQQIELEAYVLDAVSEVIAALISRGEIDPHFEFV